MKPVSFRLRIALLSTLISGLVLLGFGTGAWYFLSRQKIHGIDTELRALGTRHPGWLANRANLDRLNEALGFIFGEQREGRVILLVKDVKGEVLYVSPGWPKDLVPEQVDCSLENDVQQQPAYPTNLLARGTAAPAGPGQGFGSGRGFGPGRGMGPVVFNKAPRFSTATAALSSWRLGVMGNDELRLVVGLNMDTVQSELNRMRNAFLLALPLALFLVGGGGWLVAGRALRPLRTIAQTAEQVSARGLDQRIPLTEADGEIRHLILVLNRMMDRLEASFRQATRFSADASHELKTPLAIMQGELESGLQAAAEGSHEQRMLNSLLEQVQQLKRITSSLLLLAQADAGQLRLALEEVLLSDELLAMVEDAQVLAADSGLQFEINIPSGVKVRADRGLLRMALLNLVTNAVRYNDPGGKVGISLTNGESVTVTICNSGPGIPADDQARIFDRFCQVNRAQARSRGGLGLGLSLAREIIAAHGGKLALKESRPGLTCFTAVLQR